MILTTLLIALNHLSPISEALTILLSISDASHFPLSILEISGGFTFSAKCFTLIFSQVFCLLKLVIFLFHTSKTSHPLLSSTRLSFSLLHGCPLFLADPPPSSHFPATSWPPSDYHPPPKHLPHQAPSSSLSLNHQVR